MMGDASNGTQPSSRNPRIRIENPKTLTLVFLALYLLTLSKNYSADSLINALIVESGDIDFLVDPTHLLLSPLGYFWFQLWRGFGWSGGALLPLQTLNALGGAIASGLMFALARRFSGSLRIGAIVATGFTLSGGAWLLSTDAEFVTVPIAVKLVVLWWISRLPSTETPSRRQLVLLSLLLWLASLTYLTSIFLVAVALVALWPEKDAPVVRRFRPQATLLIVLMALLLLSAFLIIALRPPAAWGALWGEGYGRLAWQNFPRGAYAFLRSIALFPGLALGGGTGTTMSFLAGTSNALRVAFVGYYGLVLGLVALPFWLAIRRRETLWPRFKQPLRLMAAWSLQYAAFALFWVPADISFWLPLLVAWWLFVGLVLAASNNTRQAEPVDQRSRRRSLLILGILLLGAVNAAFVILPGRRLANNQFYAAAQMVAESTDAEDLIVIEDDDLALLYVRYFTDREVLGISGLTDGEVANQEWLPQTVRSELSAGRDIYILRESGADGCLNRPNSAAVTFCYQIDALGRQ